MGIFLSPAVSLGSRSNYPPEALAMLFKEKGVEPLKYFPNGHVKKEYAVLSQHILNEPARLKKLVNKSIKFSQK